MDWQNYLRVQTSNPAFLWKMVFAVLFLGAALGFLAQFLPVGGPARLDEIRIASSTGEVADALSLFRQLVNDPETKFEFLLESLSVLNSFDAEWVEPDEPTPRAMKRSRIDDAEVRIVIDQSRFTKREQEVAAELWSSLSAEQLTIELVAMSEAEPAVRYASHAMGIYWQSGNEFGKAAQAFRREGVHANAELSREAAVRMYLYADDYHSLSELAEDPSYDSHITPRTRLVVASGEQDWPALWWAIPAAILNDLAPAASFLAILTGLGWFVFLLQAGQVAEKYGVRWWMCVLAVGLGFLSIWPTDFLIEWQAATWGLERSAELLPGLKFYVTGVGLREEFCKLLLLLPLMPPIVKRRSELEALLVGACVGLGFAILENEGYFSRSVGSTIGRFLTANFFHMAATGLISLAVARAFWHGGQRILDAIAIFIVIVFLHGMYDSALAIPALADYRIVGSIIYILLAFQFFHELRPLRRQIPETVSLTATFLACISLLASTSFVYIASQLGWVLAGDVLLPEFVSVALMVYMFLREMPNSLVTV